MVGECGAEQGTLDLAVGGEKGDVTILGAGPDFQGAGLQVTPGFLLDLATGVARRDDLDANFRGRRVGGAGGLEAQAFVGNPADIGYATVTPLSGNATPSGSRRDKRIKKRPPFLWCCVLGGGLMMSWFSALTSTFQVRSSGRIGWVQTSWSQVSPGGCKGVMMMWPSSSTSML